VSFFGRFAHKKQKIEVHQYKRVGEKRFVPHYYCGHLIRIYPELSPHYGAYMDDVLKSNVIISDDISYNLENLESIKSILMPSYEIHVENRIDRELGATGAIEYFLLKKAEYYWHVGEINLSLACYAKATEMMVLSDVYWDDSVFYLICDKLNAIGETSVAARWKNWIDSKICMAEDEFDLLISHTENNDISEKKELSSAEKERIMVERITAADMLQFVDIPYNLNFPVKKHIRDGAHPFAYMDLSDFNIAVAKRHLSELNTIINEHRHTIPLLKKQFFIDIEKIEFRQYSDYYGYTRLMCTPYTFTGRVAKSPVQLSFMSKLGVRSYLVNGDIRYLADGSIQKADVNIFIEKKPHQGSTGWFFHFETIDNVLCLTKAKTTLKPDNKGLPGVVYDRH